MVKEEKIERIIRQAISECESSSLIEVKKLLSKSIVELNKTKNKKAKKESLTPLQKWQLDTSTGTLQNLNSNQMKNIIGKIEKIISNESEKFKDNEDDYLIRD